MTQAAQARLITAVLLTVLGLFVVARQRGSLDSTASSLPASPASRPAAPSPQDAVYAALDAARQGDVPKYLGWFGGELAASLRRAASDQGEARFAQYLREANEPIRGIAVNEPQPLTDREVKLRVEFVYADRNEAQRFFLEKQDTGAWRITRLETAERVKTLVPYGAPAQQ